MKKKNKRKNQPLLKNTFEVSDEDYKKLLEMEIF